MPVYSLGERQVEFRGRNWYIAPDATVIGSVAIENDASIWFKVVIRGDSDLITIGERVNIQDAAVLHTDAGIRLTLGRNASVGHQAMLHGCTVGEGSLIGIGAVILNHAVIGKHTLIGANTLIAEGKQIPDGVLVVGQPGKIVRDLTREEIDGLLKIADGYVARAAEYRQHLKPRQM